MANLTAASDPRPARLRLIALNSGEICAVVDNGSLSYEFPPGAQGPIDLLEVDWRGTSELNSVAGPSATSIGQPWRERGPRLASRKRALAALPR